MRKALVRLREDRAERLQGNGHVRNILNCGSMFLMTTEHGKREKLRDDLKKSVNKKRTEDALRQSEERLQLALATAMMGAWEWDLRTRKVSVSSEIQKLLSLNLLGDSLEESLALIHPDDRDRLVRMGQEAVAARSLLSAEFRIVLPGSRERWVFSLGRTNYDEAGQPLRMVGIAQDITERKRAERTLQESEKKYRLLAESASDVIWIFDLDRFRFTYVSPSVEKLRGFKPEEVMAGTLEDTLTPESLAKVNRLIPERVSQFQRGEGSTSVEQVEQRCKNGSTVWTEVSATISMNTETGHLEVYGITRDITERKRAENALWESEARHRMALEAGQLGTWRHDLATGVVYLDKRAQEHYGFDTPLISIDEKMARTHPADLPELNRGILAARDPAGNGTIMIEHRVLHPDGTIRWLSCQARTYFEGDGPDHRAVFAVGTSLDVTARRQAEESVRDSEEFLRSVIDNVDEGLLVFDRNSKLLAANNTFCKWARITREEIIGLECNQITKGILQPCPACGGGGCAVRQVIESSKPYSALRELELPDERTLQIETRMTPVHDHSGAVSYVIATFRDLTERHMLEAEQHKSQKLEAIGTLAGGIAHDFNNLLQGVFGYISLARLSLDEKENALGMLDQAEKALQSSVHLTNQLLTFAKGGKPVKKRILLPPLVENAVKFALSGSQSTYRITCEEDLCGIEADGGQIGQVIQNLVLNASEAMPGGGVVKISMDNCDVETGSLPALPSGGSFVRIRIQDSGVGIAERYRTRIFDPYFSTKQKGSGLGLATVYSIVKTHGGAIEVQSEVDRGTIFTIYLPAMEFQPAQGSPAPEFDGGRKAKILLMDDEEMVRTVAQRMLETLGHEVECAENGEHAFEIFRRARTSGRPFQIVILDLTIKGGLGGIDTVKRLKEIDPDLKAIVSSGYSDNAEMSNYRSHGFSASLSKPYSMNGLKDALKSLS